MFIDKPVMLLFFRTHVRRYFDSSNVRGEGNFVIFINREIPPGPGAIFTKNLREKLKLKTLALNYNKTGEHFKI